jgi:hypothetical protein
LIGHFQSVGIREKFILPTLEYFQELKGQFPFWGLSKLTLKNATDEGLCKRLHRPMFVTAIFLLKHGHGPLVKFFFDALDTKLG